MLGILSILVSAFCIWMFVRIVKSVISIQSLTQDLTQLETPDRVDPQLFMQKLNTYIDTLKTMNVRRLFSIMSDTMFHMTTSNVQGMAKLGVRREISIVPLAEIGVSPIMNDGKVKWSSAQLSCQYDERFVDTQTNAVLHHVHYDKATVVMQLTRSTARAPGETLYCAGCGMEIGTNGEVYICQHCGATYTSDSYDWIISGYSVLPPQTQTPMLKLATNIIMLLLVALPILGFLSGGKPVLSALVLLGDISVIGAVLYYKQMVSGVFKGFNEVKQIDPLSSYEQLDSRMNYLEQVFFDAINFNPNNLKPFIDPFVYAEIRQNYRPTGNYVLRVEPTGIGKLSGITRQGGKNYLNAKLKVNLTVLDSSRRIQKVTKWIAFQICRGEHVVNTHKMSAEVFTCPGCGMSINLTADGKCKFCGAEYDLSQFDWILGRVDNSMFI